MGGLHISAPRRLYQRITNPVARKEYWCCNSSCGRRILLGEIYRRVEMDYRTYRFHPGC